MGAGASSQKKKKTKGGSTKRDEIIQVGYALYEQGKLNEAKSMYEKALAMHEAEKGPSGQKYYRYLSNLATIHVDQGNFDVARDMFFKGNTKCLSQFITLLRDYPIPLIYYNDMTVCSAGRI